MRKSASFPQLLMHSTSAVLLTLLTGFLGAPFLRVIRQTQGAWRFWLTGTFICFGFCALGTPGLAALIGSLWITLGVYSELENLGKGWRVSSFISLFLGSLIGALAWVAVLRQQGVNNWESFVGLIQDILTMLQQVSPEVKFDPTLLAQQTPSILVIFLVLSLGTGLIFEKKLFAWTGLPRERVASHLNLLEFRLPDFLIWFALTAFLLTMVDFGSKPLVALGLNVVNISVVLYFFQGLAVLEVLLNSMKAGFFVRVLAYFFLVGQLFFVLSVVGLIDYWVDFRKRFSKSGMAPAEKGLK